MADPIKDYQDMITSINKLYMNMMQGYFSVFTNMRQMSDDQMREYINEQNEMFRNWLKFMMRKPYPLAP